MSLEPCLIRSGKFFRYFLNLLSAAIVLMGLFYKCSYFCENMAVTHDFENWCEKIKIFSNAVGTKFFGQCGGYLHLVKVCGKNCGYRVMRLQIFENYFQLCRSPSNGIAFIFGLVMHWVVTFKLEWEKCGYIMALWKYSGFKQ